jgi:hypothetical protein
MADVLSDTLIVPLQGTAVTAAAASANGSAKDISASFPEALALIARVTRMDGATKTVDIKLQGSADGATGWTDVVAAVQFTAVGIQRLLVPLFAATQYKYYRSVAAVAGTFGGGEIVAYDALLIGTNACRRPVTQLA